jgi:biotin carboxylase
MTTILIIGCGFPQLSLIRRARALGLDVLGVDLNPSAVGVAHCNAFERVSTSDVDAIAALLAKTGIGAMTTTGSEVSVKAASAVAARTGHAFYADPETIRRCQEKDAMRAAYAAGGVGVPPFASCATLDVARAFVKAHGYPIVVKPSRGWGQRGVSRVDGDDEIARAFEEARAQSESAGLGVAVVEAWLEGREYSVNGWIEKGQLESYCVTERITVPGKRPLGVMVAEVYPSGLDAADEARVIDEARRGALALGHTRGPCYSQVALGPRGAHLFETAARLGGGFDADVTKLASGVDLYTRVLGVALGDPALEASGEESPRHGGAIAKFLVARPGHVRAISGVDAARKASGVDDVQVFVPVGGQVYPLTDSAKRAAYVLARGATRDEATARADASLAAIRIDTHDGSADDSDATRAAPATAAARDVKGIAP